MVIKEEIEINASFDSPTQDRQLRSGSRGRLAG